MPRTITLALAIFATIFCNLAQASPSPPSRDTTRIRGKLSTGPASIEFLCPRTLRIVPDTLQIHDTIKLGWWGSPAGYLLTNRVHLAHREEGEVWVADSASFIPDTTRYEWKFPGVYSSQYLWRDGRIVASQPVPGAFGYTKGLWKEAVINVHGRLLAGTNLRTSYVGDTTSLDSPSNRNGGIPFVWKAPPGLSLAADTLHLPPLCTLILSPSSHDSGANAWRWLDSSGMPLERRESYAFQPQGPFPVLRARQGMLDWIIETDSNNFRQREGGDIHGNVRIRPYPGQPFLPAGSSLFDALHSRFDTMRLAKPIINVHRDGWEESIVTAGWILSDSRSSSLKPTADSRIWKNGPRSFRTLPIRAAKFQIDRLVEYLPSSRSSPPKSPFYDDTWQLDTLAPPSDSVILLPWKATPPVWDTSSPLEVPGMGTARLDRIFWWTGTDTLEMLAKISLNADWRRTLGRDSLLVWNKLNRPRDQILSDTSTWRPRICDFRIRVGEYDAFRLPDSSFLVADDNPVFWASSCAAGDSMVLRLEGPLRKGNRDQATYKANKRYRRAVATARGIVLDSGATNCHILSRKNGITFTVDEVVQNKLMYAGRDSGWIRNARSIARESIARSFSDPYSHPEIRVDDLHPVASRRGNLPLLEQGENPFAGTFLNAWNNHLPVRLSPDHVWMAILDGVSLHIAKEPQKWRKRLKIGHEGKRELKLVLDPRDYAIRDSASFWEGISRRLLEAMPDSTQQILEEHFLASYSTTTPTVDLAYRMKILESVQPFFDYAGSVECGIPRITLEGTPEDWIQLRTRARRLGKLGFSNWMKALEPVLSEFIKTSQGAPSLSFWRSFFRVESSGGCDIVYEANGWITRFFPLDFLYDEFRFRRNLSESLDLRFVPRGAGSFPFSLVDRTQPTQPEHRYLIVSGFVGVAQDSSTGDLSPDIGWAVFEDSSKRK